MLTLPFQITHEFTDALPADPRRDTAPRQVAGASYSYTEPYTPSAPKLVACSSQMCKKLGFDARAIANDASQRQAFTALVSGQKCPPEMRPYTMRYAGHQFGHWAGQLGDGRAIALADVITPDNTRLTLQLKGAGPTPYSRSGDGFAILRSSIREYLCSEAMHALGVPTTRALSLVITRDQVLRDPFYDGRAAHEPGAIVCRVAPSFIRFGNFQIHAAMKEHGILKQLADITLRLHYPELIAPSGEISQTTYLQLLDTVIDRTVDMVVHWQRVGFVHGVMNTDNMSVHGLTIDYGPYGWLDDYNPQWTPNTTDAHNKRYRYENQPHIAHWNCVQFAQALYPLIPDVQALQAAVDTFPSRFKSRYQQMMCSKLGLVTAQADDGAFIHALERLLAAVETDFTLFFRQLAHWTRRYARAYEVQKPRDSLCEAGVLVEEFAACYYIADSLNTAYREQLAHWFARYAQRLERELDDKNADSISPDERFAAMNRVNPKYVLRNYLAQQAIEAAEQGDYSAIETLEAIMSRPYDEQPEHEAYAQKRPEWARHKPGCSALSCSS